MNNNFRWELPVHLTQWVRRQPKSILLIGACLALAALGPVAIGVEALARPRLRPDMFLPPTRFYARPTLLSPGEPASRERVERTLRRLGYRPTSRSRVDPGAYALGARTWVIGRRAFRQAGELDPGGVVIVQLDYRHRVQSVREANGRRLGHLALEPELLGHASGAQPIERVPVALSEVPQHLVDAVLAVEDQRFFEHGGLDLRRIGGAIMANLRAGRVTQGASTITQQLVKNLYLSPRRSPLRKIREMAMAMVLERRHSKEEILQAYLNHVYLAQDGAFAIHGVGRAALYFFGEDVTQLDVSEAALLAGMIRGPSLYSPLRNPAVATERRNVVLALMRARGTIAEEVYRTAAARPLRVAQPPTPAGGARYFTDYAAERLAVALGTDAGHRGLTVFTTLDMDLQALAEEAVRDGLARLEGSYPHFRGADAPLEAALVALDPRSGEILAMVGGRDYGSSQFNRAVRARRQPGSAFKPVVALAALAGRDGYTLASVLDDAPLTVETPAGTWQPVNYDGRFRGPVTLREALERSLNVPFARLGLAVGPERIAATAHKLGIASPLSRVPSLALGSAELTPLELTRAFGVLAAGGYRADVHTTLRVLTPAGSELSRFEFAGERVYDPAEVFLVTSALQGAVERGTGQALRSMGYHGSMAGKSGTTNGFRDAWFVGYTPTLAVGVWVGFDDGRGIGLPGSRAALPIFARFMVGALGPYADVDFAVPRGIEVAEVDPETGLLAGPGCWGEPEVFLRGTAPVESCSPYWTSSLWDRVEGARWSRELQHLVEDLLRRLGRN